MKSKTGIKRVIRIVGAALMLASFFYIGRTIYKNWDTFVVTLNRRSFLFALLLCILVMVTLFIFALLYKKMLEAMAGCVLGPESISLYIRSTLYKYLPGNVMHYVGRNELAKSGKVTFLQINTASIFEAVANFISAFLVAAVFSGSMLLKYLIVNVNQNALIVGFVSAFAVGALIFVVLFRKIKSVYRTLINKRVILVFAYMIVLFGLWSVVGNSLFFFIIKSFGVSLSFSDYRIIIGACTGAWFAGFITPGSPGGMGVREAAMNFFLSGIVPLWITSAVGVLTRIAQILGELLANLVVLVFMRPRSKMSDTTSVVKYNTNCQNYVQK